jgi:hypothetical protein
MLNILGCIDTPNASDANRVWKAMKAQFTGKTSAAEINAAIAKSAKETKRSRKWMSAQSFLTWIVEIYFGETLATKEGANNDNSVKNIKILPYEKLAQLYEEYGIYCKVNHVSEADIAKETLFREVYDFMKDRKDGPQLRLLGCKGAFPTCDVCNTANEMLRNKKVLLPLILFDKKIFLHI